MNHNILGLSMEEIIHAGYHGYLPELSLDDWKYIERRFNEETSDLESEVKSLEYRVKLFENEEYIRYILELG